jgi:hypothetical protein
MAKSRSGAVIVVAIIGIVGFIAAAAIRNLDKFSTFFSFSENVDEVGAYAIQDIYKRTSQFRSRPCSEVESAVQKLKSFYDNSALVPESASNSVLYPQKIDRPTIADLAHDRVQRLTDERRDCFR